MINFLRGLFTLLAIQLASCVAIQPFPYAVRAGDTITLAIGTLDGVTSDNITIIYFPDPGSLPSEDPVDVTAGIRSVFNIYPDKKSKTYWDSTSGLGYETMQYLETISGHSSWQTVVAVDLPPTLPASTGHFVVSLDPGIVYPLFAARIDDVNINAQILEPGGNAHVFEHRNYAFNTNTSIGNLADLEQLRQVVVRKILAPNAPNVPIAAAVYEIQAPIVDMFLTDISNQVPDSDIAVVLDEQVSYDKNQTSLNWSRTGSSFKVITTSLSGNQDASAIRFSIFLANYTNAESNGWTLADSASLVSVKYFDLNGNEISGPIPEVIVQ